MPIVVRLPRIPALRPDVAVLDQRLPGFRTQYDDAMINVAVNNEMLLHRAGDRTLTDGDIVEIVPTIAGGERPSFYRVS